jgi:membrane protease YdiL (CAAX protease family)
MESTGSGAARNAPTPDPPRFKVWDPVVVFLVGQLLGAAVGFQLAYLLTGTTPDDSDQGALATACLFAGVYTSEAIVIWWYCRRRGTGSPRRDLGLSAHLSDSWLVALGAGFAVAAGIVLLPLQQLVDEEQSVVDDLESAAGAELAVFVVAVLVLAPIFEELVFRGLLLRALLRLMSEGWAIVVSALAFGAVHLLGGNVAGTLVAMPALVGLGLLAAWLAVRSGDLSRPILLHVGFNAVAVSGALLS